MDLDHFIKYLSWSLYILIFVDTVVHVVKRPLRANIDIAILFLVTTLIIVISGLQGLGFLPASAAWATNISVALLLALPYLLLRLVDDFSNVPPWLMPSALVLLVLLVIGAFASPPAVRGIFILAALAYLIGFLLYSVVAFARASSRSAGVTRRRMLAVAVGSGCLCLTFALDGVQAFAPSTSGLVQMLNDFISLASGLSYYIGFATPGVLRRAWQEPELRAFLSRSASLPRLPDTASILQEMEKGARLAVGAPRAGIGIWDEAKGVLHFELFDGPLDVVPDLNRPSGRCFLLQKPIFVSDVKHQSPDFSYLAGRYNMKSMLVAPVSAGTLRLGVLTVYAPYTSIFADEDLALVQLLADQAAVILESRALIDAASRMRAREEVTRLKEDFLSAAAHDLKTPLTTLLAQTQLLERRLTRDPNAQVDVTSVQKISKEAQRLRTLVTELLDSARAEEGKLVDKISSVNLGDVVRSVVSRWADDRHTFTIEETAPITGQYDSVRMLQLVENLIENAVKYSPSGGNITIKLWRGESRNYFSIADSGIGIPPEDMPRLFDRFHRGRNVDDKKFAGMGLGLYICRGIVEQHGGHIWAESNVGSGTVFYVELPEVIPAVQYSIAPSVSPSAAAPAGDRNAGYENPSPSLVPGTTFTQEGGAVGS